MGNTFPLFTREAVLSRPDKYDICACGAIKSKVSKTCSSCLFKRRIGSNHPRWKGGPPRCPTCGKTISRSTKKRQIKQCDKCAGFTGVPAWSLGIDPWNKGKSRSLETKLKISATAKRNYASGKRQVTSGAYKKGEKRTDEQTRKTMLGQHRKPNKQEKRLAQLLERYDLPYRYVGDGSFILGGYNPDFLNKNGEKKVIELYGDYWHRNDDPQERIDYFKKYGYETLIIWEHELENTNQVASRLSTFG